MLRSDFGLMNAYIRCSFACANHKQPSVRYSTEIGKDSCDLPVFDGAGVEGYSSPLQPLSAGLSALHSTTVAA